MSETRTVESVDRALWLLEVLAAHGAGATLEDLASATKLPKSSVHRTLAALRRRKFVTQQGDARYLLGPEFLRIAFAFLERFDVRAILKPTLDRVQRRVNETIHLGILDGAEMVYLDKLESEHQISIASRIGGRNPAHATAIGKALLAWTYPTDQAIKAWAAAHGPLIPCTPRTIVDPNDLVIEMAETRARGYAVDIEESETRVRCVAAPVFFGRADPVASISITGPRERFAAARIKQLGSILLEEVATGADSLWTANESGNDSEGRVP